MERDRAWLGHLERIEQDGIAAKDYAAREHLSVHALYQAKKRLVAQGAWPAMRRTEAPFARVKLMEVPAVAAPGSPWALRVRLPSGVVLEWSAMPEASFLTTVLGPVGTPR